MAVNKPVGIRYLLDQVRTQRLYGLGHADDRNRNVESNERLEHRGILGWHLVANRPQPACLVERFGEDGICDKAGLERFVKMDKDFIGRDALAAKYAPGGPGGAVRLVTFTVDTEPGRAGVDVIGDEPIWHDGEVVGWVTSGGYAHHSDVSVAMGYVPAALGDSQGPWEIEIVGARRSANRLDQCLWDPESQRMRM